MDGDRKAAAILMGSLARNPWRGADLKAPLAVAITVLALAAAWKVRVECVVVSCVFESSLFLFGRPFSLYIGRILYTKSFINIDYILSQNGATIEDFRDQKLHTPADEGE